MLTDSQTVIVSLFTHGLLYGIYLATLIQCLRWLTFTDEGWKPREKINTVMILTTIFIFLMSTINHAASLVVWQVRNDYGNSMSILLVSQRIVNIALQDISENLAIISIWTVIIYRCWVVYAKPWRIMCAGHPLVRLAVLLGFGNLLCGTGIQGPSFEFVLIAMKAVTGLYIVITIYTTSMTFLAYDFGSYIYIGLAAIIYRVLSSRSNSGGNDRRLNYAMRILAESGVLYTSMIMFSLIGLTFYARKDHTLVEWLIGTIANNMAFSTGGISFNLILIRVYQSRVELRDSFAD
ncbi:hypothetical protein M378DRAFT_79145 [Amanita muscaria Koide BX008]|uniref:Uncharacterized protein n=1 Tax=Amanita muscaria (strain Koide BX008) TaxID=946122 RepID=A0A0C2X3R5_AMAMK|nr:hypothetical protein M378DRAFT_79145 [Amanita muscaria Koide BX008]